jgi:hypothetical protein
MTLWKVKLLKTHKDNRIEIEDLQFVARSFELASAGVHTYIKEKRFARLRVVAIEESGDVYII